MNSKITLLSALLCSTLGFAQTEFLNPDFGTNGAACIDVPGQTIVMGDIIKVNDAFYGLTSFTNHALVKLSETGQIDPEFGTNGYVQLDLTSASGSLYDETNAFIKTTPDNNLLMVGNTGYLPEHNFMVKTDLNGNPITSFGDNGYVSLDWPDYLNVMFTEIINNEIVIVFANESWSGEEPYKYLLVMKYDLNGDPIATFGTEGKVQLDMDTEFFPESVHYFPDSGALAVLSEYFSETESYNNVTKYDLETGAVDASFGTNGSVDFYPENNNIFNPKVLYSDNTNIYLAGSVSLEGQNHSVFIRKLGLAGEPDTSFGTNGTFSYNISAFEFQNVWSITETNGYLTLTGSVRLFNPLSENIFLLRTTQNGVLDTGFGNNGFVLNPLTMALYMGAYRTLIDDDHITVATGSNACTSDEQPKPAVVQFIAESSLATTPVTKPTLEFYPNPVKDNLTITGEAITKAEVYDISGKLLYTITNPIANKINLSTLQSGLYLLKIINAKGATNIKVVKE